MQTSMDLSGTLPKGGLEYQITEAANLPVYGFVACAHDVSTSTSEILCFISRLYLYTDCPRAVVSPGNEDRPRNEDRLVVRHVCDSSSSSVRKPGSFEGMAKMTLFSVPVSLFVGSPST